MFRDLFLDLSYIKKGGKYYSVNADTTLSNELSPKEIARKKKESLESHRYYVEKALKEGKPVPKEVLADYPELQQGIPQQKPPAPKASAE